MQIQLEKHVNPDGTIDLGQVKTGLPESNVRVVIIIDPHPAHPSWPVGFLDKYYGCLADVNLQEPDELPLEERDVIL